jgi:hypothetical protein
MILNQTFYTKRAPLENEELFYNIFYCTTSLTAAGLTPPPIWITLIEKRPVSNGSRPLHVYYSV